MRKSKKKKAAQEAAAAAEAEAQEKAAAEAAEAAAAERLRAEQEAIQLQQEALRLEQERERAEIERRTQQDRAAKEELVTKLQAVHRGRAARKAAKQHADKRHEECEVRQRAYKRSIEGAKDEFGGAMFDKKKDKDYSSADDNVVAGRSLFCLGEESGVRHVFNEFLDHKLTSTCLMCCILVNVVILAVETPTNTFDDDTKATLAILDVLLSVVFSSESTAMLAYVCAHS